MAMETEFFELSARHWRAKLAISVDIMRELSQYSDPDEMFRVFAFRMNQIFPTSRQITITRRGLQEPEIRILRYHQSIPTESNNTASSEHYRLPVLHGGLLAELLYGEAPRVIDQLRFEVNDPARVYLEGQQSLLAIPLYESGHVTTMLVLTREEPAAFAREPIPELVWMSNLFSRAMQSQVLSRQLSEAYQHAQYEQKVIADLQKTLLPATIPQLSGLEVAVYYQAAGRVGGDYYDFFPLPDQRLGVLVADVSGHGSPAAVLMAITHSLAHSYPFVPDQPGEFLTYLNRELARRYTAANGHFVTALYLVVDPAAGTLTYSNAGHVAPLWTDPSLPGPEMAALPSPERLPLGIHSRQGVYPQQSVPFTERSLLILYTDGVVESTNAHHQRFGVQRLKQRLANPSVSADSAQAILARLLATWEQFQGEVPPQDDCTLLVLQGATIPPKEPVSAPTTTMAASVSRGS